MLEGLKLCMELSYWMGILLIEIGWKLMVILVGLRILGVI